MQLIKEKQFYKHLALLTVPVFLQQLLRISVDTANSLMLGSIDQTQMSAVSQSNQIYFIYSTIIAGLASGCTVLVSQFWGRKDTDSITVITAHALRYGALLGIVMTVLLQLFPGFFLRIYSSDTEIVRVGADYIRIVSLMYVFAGLSQVLFASATGVEQVSIIFKTNLVSYSLNIFLDYVLLFGKLGFPALGVRGIAIGTVCARITEFAICLFFFLSNRNIPFTLSDIRKSDPRLRNSLLKVAAPIVCHEMIWSMGTSSGSMITGQLGKQAVAGYNVTTILYDLCATLGHGLLSACSVTIGMTLGAGDSERAKKEANSMLTVGLGTGVFLCLVTLVSRDGFLSLYSLEPQSMEYARQFITVTAFVWPFSLLEMVGLIAILRAGGQGKVGFYADIVVMWMTCIPLAWLLAFKAGAEPWIVVVSIRLIIVLESIIGIINIYRYRWLNNLTGV
ncbi:MAG: MATE family efflux transporter [Erysipelotrichaceae bacterium]|nr:MATE family efflux transporter [Erysipelotrichaceae bacterium]